jgi:ComF family protein
VLAPPANDLVHALKYEGWRELARDMGREMAKVDLPRAGQGRTLVVPVPTTRSRLEHRGYNQAELLAETVAERLGAPLGRALVRVAEGRSQTALSPAERRENVRRVFAPSAEHAARVRGAHVILVDDVLTTGATSCAAAKELARSGAESVTLLAFARALPSTPGRGP